MPWDSSRRRKDPPYWPRLRQSIIDRAYGLCEYTPPPSYEGDTPQRCTYPGQDVDHIINLAKGGTDSPDNLQLLCDWHHKQKTAKEAAAARRPRSERLPKERHPGLID